MKSLIVTVAGTATRFNKDTGTETLKCLYYQDKPTATLLYQILDKAQGVDRIIIVGGYLYDRLEAYVTQYLDGFKSKIKLVYNEHFADYGSGYSLMKGIEALDEETDEVIFVEGDLFYDEADIRKVFSSSKDVLTINREPIWANKAVALYLTDDGFPRYMYDTQHVSLCIKEPFTGIFNSAQIWKFVNPAKLKAVVNRLTMAQQRGTNLEIIQGYFGELPSGAYEIVTFNTWFNCNTVADYLKVKTLM